MLPALGRRVVSVAVAAAGTLAAGPAMAQAELLSGRGELLYDTHCRACHTEQVHWRDKRAAQDWPGLKEAVRHWQAAARLAWSEADIVAVARYLNETIYHLPQTSDGIGGLPPAGPALPAARGFAHGLRPGIPP
jgi:mono/diheme cytochrome c family protein